MEESYETPEKLAVQHWNWLETLLRKIYIDAFVHGYKHGKEENQK